MREFFRSAYFRIICYSFGKICKKTCRMYPPNTIGLMFIYVHCQPCDPRGLAKRFLCIDCTEKTRSSRGGKTAYGSIAPFCIRRSLVVTKLLLRVCKKEGSCRTSVKPLVGLHLSAGLWLAVSFITQGLLRIPYQWLEPWVGLLKETQKNIFLDITRRLIRV